MTETWPPSLPQSMLRSGFSQQMADNLVRFETERGPALVRRGSTAGVETITGAIVVSSAQYATFETFHKTTTLGGALPFTFPKQVGSGTMLVRFAKEAPHVAIFAHDHWVVTFSLEVLP